MTASPPMTAAALGAIGTLHAAADLSRLNTLALPATAAQLLTVTEPAQLQALHRALATDPVLAALPRFVLGGGSNLVLTGDFPGLVLKMAIPGRELVGEDADAWYVAGGAGENWHDFVLWTLQAGYPGLENLALIPGTVGAAPIQNIGAYGLEVAERLHRVEAIDLETGEERTLTRDDCRFAYRNSLFKQQGWHLTGRIAITRVVFRLPKAWQPIVRYADLARWLEERGQSTPTPAQVAEAVMAIRRAKLPDPLAVPNAGSFFHNPVVDAATTERLAAAHPGLPRYPQPDGRIKLAAGWLIEQSGWKGKRLGPAGMYEKQALVLVNLGGAKGADVAAVMRAVQADVVAKFGVELTPEPIFLCAP